MYAFITTAIRGQAIQQSHGVEQLHGVYAPLHRVYYVFTYLHSHVVDPRHTICSTHGEPPPIRAFTPTPWRTVNFVRRISVYPAAFSHSYFYKQRSPGKNQLGSSAYDHQFVAALGCSVDVHDARQLQYLTPIVQFSNRRIFAMA